MAAVVVTGASGFLGAHYLKRTARTHPDWRQLALVRNTPLGFALPGVLPVTCDLVRPGSAEVLAALQPEVVVHMAAAILEPDAPAINAAMMATVLDCCRRSGARLVYVSSSQVHFAQHNRYAASKHHDELAIAASGVPATVVRPAAPYGAALPDHRPSRDQSMHVLARFVASRPVVPVIGDGRYTRQPVHVDDFTDAINHLIAHERFDGEAWDIGGPDALTMDEVVDTLARVAGRRVRKLHLPKALFLAASRVVQTLNADLLSTVDCDEQVDSAPILALLGRSGFTPFAVGASSLFSA